MKRLILFAGLVVWPVLALAQTPVPDLFTGDRLYKQYQGYKLKDPIEFELFASYVSGLVDGQLLLQASKGTRADWCAPDDARLGQHFEIVGRYLEAHPEKRHELRGRLVVMALAEAWPCRR